MILTYKIKHNYDFSLQLQQAKQVAEFAIRNRDKISSKYVKHIGLKSAIANQILRKYGRNKNTKKVNQVKLTIPNQAIKLDQNTRTISIPCLNVQFKYEFKQQFSKINQIEVGPEWFYVSVDVEEQPVQKATIWIGVDLNTTGHCCVAANPTTGKVLKLGKKAYHIHNKYRNIRKHLQRLKKGKKLKTIRRREQNIERDLNHKISKKLVEYAKKNECGLKLEDLKGIRKAKSTKSFRYGLNSWSFYQLRQMIEYKAKLRGVEVCYIDPAYTSKECSRCGLIANRNGKVLRCPNCGHVAHADVDAAFTIASRKPGVKRSKRDRDRLEGNTDIPQAEMGLKAIQPQEPAILQVVEYVSGAAHL